MIKEDIKYVDFNGNEQVETAYFNMNRLEASRIQAHIGEDIQSYVKKLVDSKDVNKMLNFMDELILDSYGQRSEDGKRFIKNAELKKQFSESAAYATFFEGLLNDPKKAEVFGNGVASAPAQLSVVEGGNNNA